ncbi:pyridoxal phosphate-dependent aminotransferase [Desulfonatronospira sp. MSAO_Bac3]|uniref:pyridoxal phosphate-dependent aminotransferase n=1 Tax=Desulfonatronospira sp. MSAO_Bac3 TaxID=2293857 RepID=UPI000FF644CF|nr:pyridoxal phosphate-dependent aminotransferase [Desulfonatronospira sp. MSAO_Bac3]RQD77714.1 MAG: pyridoxal phosphate-dependent aminotransferase [Desulfonatronospira sp. MSAO_Bac3]
MSEASIAQRCSGIKPFYVMEILERAKEMEKSGRDIIHLEIGEPDFDTPECVKEAAHEAMHKGCTHYTHSLGIPELRQAISRHYQDYYSVEVDPDRILVTSGTSPAMLLLFSTLLHPGDGVILPDPHYACYPSFICFAGGRQIKIPTSREDGFQLHPDKVRKHLSRDVKAIFINSPSNPTGNLLSDQVLQELAGLGPWMVSDEIYHGLVYEGRERSILEFTDRAFVLNGFSKLYAMTGWRLGYLIAPEPFVRTLQTLHQNFFISANSVAQWAAVAALEKARADVSHMKEVYNQRRKYMLERLKGMGFGIGAEPTGAFYILADAGFLSRNSYQLAFDILEKAGVGVTPGIDFGDCAEGHIRFSYANSLENIEKGMDRLQQYVNENS